MRAWVVPMLLGVALACGCAGQTGSPTGAAKAAGAAAAGTQSDTPEPPNLEGKRVVMVVAQRDFRDEELLKPKALLEKAGARVTVASSSLEPAMGALGAKVTPDVLLKDVDADAYEAVVFIGGPGAKEYWDDRIAHALARAGVEQGKVVAAICLAPVTLANAGLLDGKKATVWRTESGRLRAQGAQYTGTDVEVDGRLITSNGPEAAEDFGKAIAEALAGEEGPPSGRTHPR
jgi:protease I